MGSDQDDRVQRRIRELHHRSLPATPPASTPRAKRRRHPELPWLLPALEAIAHGVAVLTCPSCWYGAGHGGRACRRHR